MYRLGRVKMMSACRDFVVCTVAWPTLLSLAFDQTGTSPKQDKFLRTFKCHWQKHIFVSLYPRYLGDLTSIHYSLGMVHLGESSLYDAQ